MIVVLVEHFLSEEGQRYFPTWIEETAEVLRDFDGFVSIRQLTDIDNPERCQLLLRFESLDLLRAWADSEEHDRMIGRLAPYQKREQNSEIFRAESEYRGTVRRDADRDAG
jgi:antibiotic biosynthesis monooxygenase (ABM) superfamily enzyme